MSTTIIKKVYIDSRDRIRGSSSNNFTVSLGNNTQLNNVKSIMLTDAVIPISWYNVDNNNNKFYFSFRQYGFNELPFSSHFNDEHEQHIVTLDIGNYTTSSLMVELKTKVDLLLTQVLPNDNLSIDLTYNTTNSKFTITADGAYANGSDDDPGIFMYYNVWDKLLFNRYHSNLSYEKTINFMLGIGDDIELQRPPLNSSNILHIDWRNQPDKTAKYTSDTLHQVFGMEYLYITSNLCIGNTTSQANSSMQRVLSKIPLHSYYSELNYTNPSTHLEPVDCSQSNFNEIDLSLVNRNNELIDMNGGEYSATLNIYYHDQPE